MGEAIVRALRNEDSGFAQTRWSDALSTAMNAPGTGVVWYTIGQPPGGLAVHASRGITGQRVCRRRTHRRRGGLDLFRGVGMRRSRRDLVRLQVGNTLDCWRVEVIEPQKWLRLAAEMKLPGRTWLEFEVQPDGDGAPLRQTATFDPLGPWGLAYWYGVWPLHQFVFAGMLRGPAQAARKMDAKRKSENSKLTFRCRCRRRN